MPIMPKSTKADRRESRRQYSLELRNRAVSYVINDGKSVAQVAQMLDINTPSLFVWVREARLQAKLESTTPETPDEELRRLRAENRELRLKREILKKATAFFAKESK